MAKSWRLVVGVALFFVGLCSAGAIVGCGKDRNDGNDRDEQTTKTRSSALTTSLFEPYVSYLTGSRPEVVAIGDLDGDGRNDVALLTSTTADPANDNMVHVFLQDTDGSLKPRVRYPVGGPGTSIDIGDVNGDGRADVVVGLRGTTFQLGVLLQNASGTLDAMVPHPTANSYQVKVGDFNGDGRMDVAGINSGALGDGLDVFLQTDTGTLAAPVTTHVSHGGLDELDAGDIDGDGRTDLVVMSGQGAFPNVNVLLQTADGVLGAPTPYSLSGNTVTKGVALGDTNGDGRSDIVVSYGGSRPNSFIARFPQTAQGAMDPAAPYASYDNPSAIIVADVDADGRKDVLVTHTLANRLGVYRQYPSGDFVNEELYTIPSANLYQPQGLAVGDINGDGRPDAVIADNFNGLVVLRQVQDVHLALAVTAPASGSLQYVDEPLTVRWTTGNNVTLSGFDVSVSFNNGASYTPIAGCTGLPATATECPWTPTAIGTGIRARVTARDGAGQTASSETTFNVTSGYISVTAPNLGSFVGVGTTTTVTWFHNLPASGTVRIELSRDGGASYETLAAAAPNTSATTGSFDWLVTGPTASVARIRVTSNGPAAVGTCNFNIQTPPTLTLALPGTTLFTTSLSVAWTSSLGLSATVRAELSRDGGATFQTIGTVSNNEGGFATSVSGPGAADARIRITLTSTIGLGTATATSASFTLVQGTLAVTGPVAGATAYTGTPLAITWSTNLPASWWARVELSRNGGSTYELLGASLPNTGSFAWAVTGSATAAAQVRVTVGNILSTAASSGTFAIAVPSLTVTGPAAGASALAGTPLTITWSTNLPATSPVLIQLTRTGGTPYETVAASAPNTGSFTWTVTGPATSAAQVRLITNSPVQTIASSGTFAIAVPSLTVTSPAAGASLFAGTSLAIAWSTNLPAGSPALVELSRNGGSTYEVLAASAPNTGSFATVVTGPATSTAQVRVTITGPGSTAATGGTFAIVVPSLTVTSPTAGASLLAGTSLAITWSTNLPAGSPALVELSRNGGGAYEVLAASASNTGSFAAVVTGPGTSAAQVRVTITGPGSTAATSGTFAIAMPSLTVTGPGAGATFYAGSPLAITWSTNVPASTPVSVEVSRDGGSTFQTLAASAPNTGSLVWIATGPDSAAVLARVSVSGPLAVSGTGGMFAIITPALAVTGPSAGTVAYAGTPVAITWTHNLSGVDPVSIELSRDGGVTFELLAAAAANTGSFVWTAFGPDTGEARVRITSTGALPASGVGSVFAIVSPSLTVTGPAAGALAYTGTPVTITWTHNLSGSDPVSIELSRDGGATYGFLAAAVANTGSFVWTASGPDTAAARVRVTSTGAVPASGVGPAFQIVTGTLAVTSPTAGASWAIGTARTIAWSSSNLPAGTTVLVQLSRDGGTSWTTLASAASASGGSLAWTATGPATTTARVRVSANGGVAATATSGAFAIANPTLAVTAPATGASWTIGVAQTIAWTSNLLSTATVKIELSRNGGSTYTTLSTAAPNTGSFAWTATASATTTAKVRVSANGFTASSVSGTFSIVAASVKVTSPNTAVTWNVGSVHAITWTHNLGAAAQFKIEVSRSGVFSVITPAATGGGATSGSYNWTVAAPKSTNAKIRVTWTGVGATTDSSDVAFKIN